MSKEEKMLILEMVKEGKITPEQGVELLNALGEPKPSFKAPLISVPGISDDLEDKEEQIEELVESRAESLAERISSMFAGGVSRGPRFELLEEFEGELDPEGEIEVNLHSTNGAIEVRSWDKPGYHLEVLKKVNARTEEEAKRILEGCFEFSHKGSVLTGVAKGRQSFGNRNLSVDFILTIPADRSGALNLHSANGRITVEDVSGPHLIAKTANGRIEVSNGQFETLELNTANGRIVIENVSGKKCTAETMNGRIEAEDCRFDDVEMTDMNGRIEYQGESRNMMAKTMNGRIVAELTGTGNWNLKTSNGPIEVKIHKGEADFYEVDLSSNNGAIDVGGLDDVDVIIDERRKHLHNRRYKACSKGFAEADSKGSLKASTSSGRISVEFL
ncbi:MAG TPA: DUF4097 family beta strand repeat-containing protein [Bacillota bacterium]|nr:DUF4097 family beta strand repeat-containing protein [Bacillota bacterium]